MLKTVIVKFDINIKLQLKLLFIIIYIKNSWLIKILQNFTIIKFDFNNILSSFTFKYQDLRYIYFYIKTIFNKIRKKNTKIFEKIFNKL